MESQTPVLSEATPQVIAEQPKQLNILVILLSILLIISVAISGFFAFQTQKLVKELTVLRTEPTSMPKAEPTAKPAATFDNVDSWTTVQNDNGFSFRYPPISADSSIDFKFIEGGMSGPCDSKIKSETRYVNGKKLTLDYYVFLTKGICETDNLNRLVTQVPGYPVFMVLYKDSDREMAISFLDAIISTFKFESKRINSPL